MLSTVYNDELPFVNSKYNFCADAGFTEKKAPLDSLPPYTRLDETQEV